MDSGPLSLAPGGLFNERYEVVRCIASGGMGAVYEVIHRDTRKRRALKIMLPQLVSNETLRQRFKQEATVIANVDSQHVVEIVDAGVDNATGAPFIVMELLKGNDLQQVLEQKGPMSEHQLAELLRQTAMALDRTHAEGIVHRDLKPENLFVTRRDDGTPHVKVLDFGIAKVVAESQKATNQTATIGTPLYMAPEQIQAKKEIGASTDVYALAQVAYTMLVGEAYFAEDSDQAQNTFQLIVTVAKGVTETAKERAERRKGVKLSDAVSKWFMRATAVEPPNRFPSPGALAAAFKDAVGGTGDFRMSLPDVSAVGGGGTLPTPPTNPDLSTGEFLAASQSPAELAATQKAAMQKAATQVGAGSAQTQIADPNELPTAGAHAGGAGRTTSAAIAASPDTSRSGKRSSRWPLFAVAGAIVLAGGFTVWRTAISEDPAETEETVAKPAKSAPASSSGDASTPPPAASCPAGMVSIARTTFAMGGDAGEDGPIHKVTIGPYCIDRLEVAVADYRKCADAGKCEKRTTIEWQDATADDHKRYDSLCNFGQSDRDKHPINCIDWKDANNYCTFAGKRLPSEPEWELAARGAKSTTLPWGEDAPSPKLTNACGLECREHFAAGSKNWVVAYEQKDEWAGTGPADSLKDGASPFGLLHTGGNVMEWTADWFTPYEGSTTAIEDPKSPPEPSADPRKVLRGGSFFSSTIESLTTFHRIASPATKRAASYGLRCAQ